MEHLKTVPQRLISYHFLRGGRFGFKHTMWGVLVTDEQTNEQWTSRFSYLNLLMEDLVLQLFHFRLWLCIGRVKQLRSSFSRVSLRRRRRPDCQVEVLSAVRAAAAAGGGRSQRPPIAASAFDGSESQLALLGACEAAERLQGLQPPPPSDVTPPPSPCSADSTDYLAWRLTRDPHG